MIRHTKPIISSIPQSGELSSQSEQHNDHSDSLPIKKVEDVDDCLPPEILNRRTSEVSFSPFDLNTRTMVIDSLKGNFSILKMLHQSQSDLCNKIDILTNTTNELYNFYKSIDEKIMKMEILIDKISENSSSFPSSSQSNQFPVQSLMSSPRQLPASNHQLSEQQQNSDHSGVRQRQPSAGVPRVALLHSHSFVSHKSQITVKGKESMGQRR